MRMIDADALKIDYGFTWDDITPTHEEMYALIDRQPTAQPKKGKWIGADYDWDIGIYMCDQCEKFAMTKSGFCPNCGADMRGEEDG